jgi:ATP-dependent Lhr-like helicase
MSIGTIVGDNNLIIEFMNGSKLGQIEEYFISSLKPGDHFWFAGRALEFVRIREMKVQVRKSSAPQGKVPSWMGGRMPLSSQLSAYLREKCDAAAQGLLEGSEMAALEGLLGRQAQASVIPSRDELLIEYVHSSEGYHLFVFPFEGRLVHEGMAALFAYRISRLRPISFSIAMNDYGFELLSDQRIELHESLARTLCSTEHLRQDIMQSLNATEMARRQFGEICRVAGLVFQGFPGAPIRTKHLKASSHLLFDVFYEYEPDNLLIQQALDQALQLQLDESRMRLALKRIATQKVVIRYLDRPTPFCFPIMADRLREKMSTETLADRLKKIAAEAVSG